jgi:UDP-N-acetylglucosamine:LPS N-acetylglucosamine transferase
VLLPQADLDGARLARTIRALAEQPERLQRMQSAMKALGRPDAAAAIVDWISEETGQT